MNPTTLFRAALVLSAMLLSNASTRAASTDYAFEAVQAPVRSGAGSEPAVRLMHNPSGKPVGGAIPFRPRLDVSPDTVKETAAQRALVHGAVKSTLRIK